MATNAALKYVQANGLKFAYFEEGTGPLVLLLHGFPDTPHSWDAVRPALAQAGFRAVSPYTRGYAPTEIPRGDDFGSDTLGRDAAALIEALGEKQAIVVGHDFGASAAFSIAGLFPEKVAKIVTIAIPHPAGVRPTPALLWGLRHFLRLSRPGAADWVRAGKMAYIDELVQRWSPTWKVPPGETDAVKESFKAPGCLEAVLGYYRATGPAMTPGQKRKVTSPAVAFCGLDDMATPAMYEQARSRYLGPYEVVKMPGGHFMHREHPEHFIRELLRVLGAH